MTTRLERLKDYQRMKGPCGASRDQANLDYWARRASQNSDGDRHRASGDVSTNGACEPNLDLPKVPDTGKQMNLRDTASRPYRSRKVDDVMAEAKRDLNFVGSKGYMPGVRRTES